MIGITIDPTAFAALAAGGSTLQLQVGSLARYLRKRCPHITLAESRDHALAAIVGAIASIEATARAQRASPPSKGQESV